MRTTLFWRVGTALIGIALLTIAAQASITIALDFLDPSDGGDMPPPHIIVVDFRVDVSPGDVWTAGGVRGEAFAGAQIRYGTWADPNMPGAPPQVVLVNPGTDDRFVTVVSEPRGRFSNSRFTNGHVELAGRYFPTGPIAVASPTEVNAVYFSSPPETNGYGGIDGWVFRLALDISPVAPIMRSAVEVAPPGQEQPGWTPLFLSSCYSETYGGICAATFDDPSPTGFDWGVYARLAPPEGDLPGDLDLDCDVDLADLVTLLANFGTPSGGGAEYEEGDIFGDGGVDLTDLTALLSRFGEVCP